MTTQEGLKKARELDKADELASFREEFLIPRGAEGEEVIYFCGNSLGLQPKRTKEFLERELQVWAEEGVEGHFGHDTAWYDYHELLQESLAAVVGAKPSEVVAMGSLTTNLHLLMVSFYKPTKERHKILIEGGAFPSDRYAVQSQAHFHGLSPAETIVELQPRQGEETLREEDILAKIEELGDSLALVLLGGVNYYTGQFFDLESITTAGHKVGAKVGFDLAHAAGNVSLKLHDWGPDFAAWCTYKYLNSGPGGVAGIFVHHRHGQREDLPRFAGWWGNDPKTRFEMGPTFSPQEGAAGWQLSNAPILSMAAHRASLSLFQEAGMEKLRAKGLALSGFLREEVEKIPGNHFEVITPREEKRRGCQVSILAPGIGEKLFAELQAAGVVCDYRRPDVIRVAPVPLYNTFEEVWRFVEILRAVSGPQ